MKEAEEDVELEAVEGMEMVVVSAACADIYHGLTRPPSSIVFARISHSAMVGRKHCIAITILQMLQLLLSEGVTFGILQMLVNRNYLDYIQ